MVLGKYCETEEQAQCVEAKHAPTATAPVPAKTAQTPVLSQEVPSCLKSLTPTTRSGEEQSLEAASSTMAAPTANASAATTERPATSAPQVAAAAPTPIWNHGSFFRFITEDLVAAWAKVPSSMRRARGYLTGHCSLRYHLKKLNLSETETCRFCALEQETSEHVLRMPSTLQA
ncbi:hypothetical protein ACLKA7_000898 [Drosophila subpalustris]